MLTLQTADVVTGFALVEVKGWYEDGEIDSYDQFPMEKRIRKSMYCD